MTRKITKETINGADVTVIRKPFDADWVKSQLRLGLPVPIYYEDKILHIQDGFITSDGAYSVLYVNSTDYQQRKRETR